MTTTRSFTRFFVADDELSARSEARVWGKGGDVVRVVDITMQLLQKEQRSMYDDGDAENGPHLHIDPLPKQQQMLLDQLRIDGRLSTHAWAVTQRVTQLTPSAQDALELERDSIAAKREYEREELVLAVKADGNEWRCVAQDDEELRELDGTSASFGQCMNCGSFSAEGEPVAYTIKARSLRVDCEGCGTKYHIALQPAKDVVF